FTFLLFFNSSPAHQDLHSFPTRRSSDLRRPGGVQLQLEPRPLTSEILLELLGGGGECLGIVICGGERRRRAWEVQAAQHPVGVRSEEHTSELQSPCNLVCRLLLEKKKTV